MERKDRSHAAPLRRAGGMIWTLWRRLNKEIVRAVYRTRAHLPTPLVRLGSDYGGWRVPEQSITPDWICYAVGVGCDATFDLAIIDRFGCTVHGFDPTPRAIRYVEGLEHDPERYVFHPIGIWTEDTTLSFFAPADPDATSHSVYDLGGTGRKFDAPCKTLRTVMKDLGHDRIDLLKMDVEGAWMPIVEWLADEHLTPKVLCIEFDSPTSLARVARARKHLGKLGLRLAHVEKENFVFLHEDLCKPPRKAPEQAS